jgi:hypothetical protein
MIDYTLAKELKDAGFPQTGSGGVVDEFGKHWESFHKFNCDVASVPTLEELIEACGTRFRSLEQLIIRGRAKGWVVNTWGNPFGQGDTPTEAVARLWLVLNKKV